jgi:hypothetical protein
LTGVLNVDGFWSNNIRSVYGALVMKEQGHVDGDIDVRGNLLNAATAGA